MSPKTRKNLPRFPFSLNNYVLWRKAKNTQEANPHLSSKLHKCTQSFMKSDPKIYIFLSLRQARHLSVVEATNIQLFFIEVGTLS